MTGDDDDDDENIIMMMMMMMMKGRGDRLDKRMRSSQTEIYPVQYSTPQPKYWMKFLDPWVRDFYPVLDCSLAPS